MADPLDPSVVAHRLRASMAKDIVVELELKGGRGDVVGVVERMTDGGQSGLEAHVAGQAYAIGTIRNVRRHNPGGSTT